MRGNRQCEVSLIRFDTERPYCLTHLPGCLLHNFHDKVSLIGSNGTRWVAVGLQQLGSRVTRDSPSHPLVPELPHGILPPIRSPPERRAIPPPRRLATPARDHHYGTSIGERAGFNRTRRPRSIRPTAPEESVPACAIKPTSRACS